MLEVIVNEYITLLLIPILVGVLEVIKRAEFLNTKYIPIVSVFLGIAMGIIFTGFEMKEGIIAGLYIGLSAVGLFSTVKNTTEGVREE